MHGTFLSPDDKLTVRKVLANSYEERNSETELVYSVDTDRLMHDFHQMNTKAHFIAFQIHFTIAELSYS